MLTICINGCEFALHLNLTLFLFLHSMEMRRSLLCLVDRAWVGHPFGSVPVSAWGCSNFTWPAMLFGTGYNTPYYVASQIYFATSSGHNHNDGNNNRNHNHQNNLVILTTMSKTSCDTHECRLQTPICRQLSTL